MIMPHPAELEIGVVYKVNSTTASGYLEWEVISQVIGYSDAGAYWDLKDLHVIKNTDNDFLETYWDYKPSSSGWDGTVFERLGNKEECPEYFL